MISPDTFRGAIIGDPPQITNLSLREALALTIPNPETRGVKIATAGIVKQAIRDARKKREITVEHPFGMGEQIYTPKDVGVIFEHIKERVSKESPKKPRLKRMGLTEANISAAKDLLLEDPSGFT
jgi:hypothetical protein